MTSDFKVYEKKIMVVDIDGDGDSDGEDGGAKQEEEIIELDIRDFMKPDYYTGDYNHFYVLKSNPNNAQKGQKLNFKAIPSVGQAMTHALYSPVGCVAFEYDKDTEEMQGIIFGKQIDQRNHERLSKTLDPLTENEIDLMRRSFDRLDSARVYKQNRDGECNSINLTVESIGVYSPLQAFLDGLHVLEIELIDLMNGIVIDNNHINFDEGLYEFYFKNNHAFIKLIDHGHTIGNLLKEYMNRLTLVHLQNFEDNKHKVLYKSVDTVLEVATYRITHPLEGNLLFEMKLANSYEAQFADLYKDNTWDKTTARKAPYAIMFYKAAQYAVENLKMLQEKFITAQTEQTMGVSSILKQEHVVQLPGFRREDDNFVERLFYE
jgi:DNA-directed RNA polymerase subunit L